MRINKDLLKKFEEFIKPISQVCRLYILKEKSLTPIDATNSDPYLYIKSGSFVQKDVWKTQNSLKTESFEHLYGST